MTHDDLYIGYRKRMAPAQARFLRRRLVVLGAGVLAVAVVLVAAQHPFSPGVFEYGVVKHFSGIIGEDPYPTLILNAPLEGVDAGVGSRVYLVAPGKHGAQELVKGLGGRGVQLDGSLIHRDHQVMIEIRPASMRLHEAEVFAAAAGPTVLGDFTLRGEIVDSKCYLGVMKPGNLKPHKACAIRCISGGCTPMLVVRDARGLAAYFMLAGADGRPVNQEVLDNVAEPLEIRGTVERIDNLLVLKAEPRDYRRLDAHRREEGE